MVTGEIYHVYNRGAEKLPVFRERNDFLRFYRSMLLFNTQEPVKNFRLAGAYRREIDSKRPLVEIHAYSLLDNHFHILLKQVSDGGVSEYIKRLVGGYTSFVNEKYGRSGVLFQGRYKKVHVSSDEQYRYLFAYVNENHFVHGLSRPSEIVYSSSLHYQNIVKSKLILRTQEYAAKKEQLLAREIYERRGRGMRDTIE